jgi:hypothetical protein
MGVSGEGSLPGEDKNGFIGKHMPYYSESEAHALREQFEEIVLTWPAILVTGGIILTRLNDDQKSALLSSGTADYFSGHGRVMKKWIVIAIKEPSSVERYLPFIRASYEAALAGKDARS